MTHTMCAKCGGYVITETLVNGWCERCCKVMDVSKDETDEHRESAREAEAARVKRIIEEARRTGQGSGSQGSGSPPAGQPPPGGNPFGTGGP